MLSSNLNTPYPPPDLLHPMAEKIQILSSTPQNQSPPEKPEAPAAAPTASPAQPADKQAPNK
jgi:nucleoid-associated protein YgaU